MQHGVKMLEMSLGWEKRLKNSIYFSGSSPEVVSCVNTPTVSLTSLFGDCQTFDVKVTHACRHSLGL